MANVWFGFSVFALENCGFSVLGSSTVCGFFLNLVFGLQFSSKVMAVFRILLSSVFYGFSGFAKETKLYPVHRLYSVLPFLFKGMDDKPSLFGSRYVDRNGKAQDIIKTKDYSFNIRRLG